MKEEIRFIQELSTLTWPPKLVLNQNGWKLRLSNGITDRVNSVSPIQYSGNNLIEDIFSVEKIYAKNNLKTIFQLADYFEPQNLKDVLLEKGYSQKDETIVMKAGLEEINALSKNEEFEIFRYENKLEKWIEVFKSINYKSLKRIDGIKDIILRMNKANVRYYIAVKSDNPIAVGLTVSEDNYMFIYNMFTQPEYRRQKIAQSILMEMFEWADISLVDHLLLQVESDNFGAIKLYEKAGFKERYRYRYLVKEETR